MPDWLIRTFDSDVDTNVSTLVARQLLALGLGCLVGWIYRLALSGNAVGWPGSGGRARMEMVATLVLLTVLISMMTAVIGDNIARAFSIVGALSIVRFRTVVEDTRDTAFVIFAVAVGMAVGAGQVVIPLITIPIVAFAAMAIRPRLAEAACLGAGDQFLVTVRTGVGYAGDAAVRKALQPLADSIRVTVVESARQGAAFETTYALMLRREEHVQAAVAALNGIEGVQHVGLRRA